MPTAEGTCRCGTTVIATDAPPFMTCACHCTGCQAMSASAFSLTAMVPAATFRIVRGNPIRGGAKGPQLHHFFCPECLTWMFTRIAAFERDTAFGTSQETTDQENSDQENTTFVNVRPILFDEPEWCVPFIETMTDEKLPWATTPAEHRFARFPTPDDFPALIAAFAQRPL